ncbi:MAG: hypothetical protein V2B14_04975 [bacterium]
MYINPWQPQPYGQPYSYNDIIFGSSRNDRIFGGYGNDQLFGCCGNDQLFGGLGQDVLYGGQGNDYLVGGQGRDILIGGSGYNRIYGGQGDIIIADYNDQVKASWGSRVLRLPTYIVDQIGRMFEIMAASKQRCNYGYR